MLRPFLRSEFTGSFPSGGNCKNIKPRIAERKDHQQGQKHQPQDNYRHFVFHTQLDLLKFCLEDNRDNAGKEEDDIGGNDFRQV